MVIKMKTVTFSVRNAKEILRDPLTVIFSLLFPIVLLLFLSAIQANIPVSLFEIETLAPGMTVFALTFMTLFSATLISKDRESAFLQRLYATPLTSADFILGYTAPMLVISVLQCTVCYITAFFLGLKLTVNLIPAILLCIPTSLLFISLGLLCGSILSSKQVGGLCGALLTNLTAWLSGIWFDLDLVGGMFKKIAYVLPFVHAVEIERAAVAGTYSNILPHLWWVLGYTAVIGILAVIVFLKQSKKQ